MNELVNRYRRDDQRYALVSRFIEATVIVAGPSAQRGDDLTGVERQNYQGLTGVIV